MRIIRRHLAFTICLVALSAAAQQSDDDAYGPIRKIGPGVTPPSVTHQVEALFSEQARKNKVSGVVLLSFIVDRDGVPQNPRVLIGLGMGLDEKAVEALKQYRFTPAMENGQPVAVRMSMEVDFRLYGSKKDDAAFTASQEKAAQALAAERKPNPKDAPSPAAATPAALAHQPEDLTQLPLATLQLRATAGDPTAQFSLGKMYFIAGDYAQALAWFGKAAEQGNAPAQINVGSMFANGMGGVSVDFRQAVAWYSKAAEQGNPQAQTDLGFMLADGRGISLDYKQAAFWYRKAADQGYAPAETYLGMMYADGRGVPQDPKQAVELTRLAADQGFALAQHNLALAYDSGIGVPVDHAQAQVWSRDASSGHASDETDTQWADLDTRTPVAVNPEALPQPAALPGSIASSSPDIRSTSAPSRETVPKTSNPSRGFTPEPLPNSGPASAAPISIPHNYALIFATDDYAHWPHLTNPISDADAVNQTLTSLYNFHVEEIRNATDDQILTKLTEYLHHKFEPQDQLLIYFSGHGYFDPDLGKGFLVPANALRVPDDIGHRSLLAHETIMGYVNRIPAIHVVLILDACFAGTLDRRIADSGLRGNVSDVYAHATLPELLARKEAKRTRRYITSGGKDFVPDGLPGHHSPFISAFLVTLNQAADRKGYVTLDDIQQGLDTVNPEPRWGDIQDDNDPGADFLLLTPDAVAQLTKSN
jgi:TonB family protein